MKKLIVALLTAILLLTSLSVLSACGGTKYDPDNFLPEGTEENPYQIVKNPVTIRIFVPRGSMNPEAKNIKFYKKLSELTNLKFEFIEADVSALTTLRAAAWNDKENLPDLFLFGNPVSEQVTLMQYGAMVPFNDDSLVVAGVHVGNLIENYMPNYKRLLENNFYIETKSNAIKVATMPDGKMYSTLSVKDVPRDLTYKMFINQKWIDNINARPDVNPKLPNADEIRTIEDYITVLRAFKKYDANLNGDPDDEIPVSAASLNYLRNFILAAYGYVSHGVEIENDGSQFVYTPTTEAYKKYLETMRLLYKEKLLDNNTFSMKTEEEMAGKGGDGRLGSFCSAAAYLTVGYELESQYVTFGPLTSSYYTGEPIHLSFGNFQATGAVIPTGTPYVREIARLLDIMYSELGVQLISYGEEGVDFVWEDDEKTSWKFIVPDEWKGKKEEYYRATLTPNVGTANALYWSYEFLRKMNDPIIRALNLMSERYVPYLKLPYPEEIKLSAKEYEDVSYYGTSLSAYLESAEYAFVIGKKTIESDWENFQKDLVKYNCNKIVQAHNNALARYKQQNG